MKLHFLFYSTIFFSILLSCSDNKGISEVKNCPCDSMTDFKTDERRTIQCYIGKSMIEISQKTSNDTIDVTRRYTEDTIWHFQEFIEVVNNQITHPEIALYCDFKDSAEFYKVTFVRDENVFKREGASDTMIEGTDLILDSSDTISSKNLSLLVPKDKFKGIVKVDKKLSSMYQGERLNHWTSIYIEAESMIKYGNLLEQYKAINRLCNRNSIRQEDLH
jgi:hypothetical protein